MAVSSGEQFDERIKHKSGEDSIKANSDNIQEIVTREIRRLKCLGEPINLNHIDVSEVTDMSGLFRGLDIDVDIYLWNTHNVIYMSGMFEYSSFDGEIPFWDVSNVEDMRDMFKHSKFKGDISRWDVKKVKIYDGCFDGSLCPPANRPKFNP